MIGSAWTSTKFEFKDVDLNTKQQVFRVIGPISGPPQRLIKSNIASSCLIRDGVEPLVKSTTAVILFHQVLLTLELC